MSTLAVAMQEVNNQQTFNLNLDAIHACKFQVQQIIGRRVVDMLEDLEDVQSVHRNGNIPEGSYL